MMKKILAAITVALSTFCLSGCKETYLDLKDTGSISPADFPTSLSHLDLMLVSVYGVQHEWGFLGHYWHGYSVFCLDHTVDLQWRGDESWIGICIGTARLGENKVQQQWRDIQKGIYFANSTLEAIQQYRAIAPVSEKQAIDNIEGQALFLRGFYLWHLQTLYGQPNLDGMGVPIIRSVPKELKAMSVPRATTRDSYQAMIEDFKKAEKLLEGQNSNRRATKWSAKAALAKTYLFAEKPDSAKIYLEDCIKNSGKSLVTFDHYRNMFNGDTKFEYNSESFYEVGNRASPELTHNNGSRSQNTGSTVSLLYTPFYIDNVDNERKAMGYSNQFMHDRNLVRFGYTDVPPFRAMESVNGTWKLKDDYLTQQRQRRAQAGKQADGPDPRLYVAALQPFIDSVKVYGKFYKVAQAEFGKWYTLDPATGLSANDFYGWPLRKNQYLDGKLEETKNVAGANFYFIRLADIYLMYAEVMKATDPALALEYVNKVKRRAYGYNPNAASPVDYPSLSARTKAPADDHLANDPILYERWAEFFGEAKWWEDVRRLKLGPKEAAFFKTVAAGRKIVWRDEHYAMPIPPLEFETNTNPGMKQNPGY
ncbi:putative outer membrane starch-binding protein [Larkinella arboricola]|uniref:Putative outer membrane starch-binding protein n=1 Tax=Larkinella arboricola TaxID=643671 RepID=A0A327XGA1_LARAB|nr:RagB/SusD family nutrient uptake outer membrane protein [Larkinella arboricola]RAK03196.1 putative outer membrane starch-binding protein [Larkinella arboricola]